MAKLELKNEPISCAKALISYFALYFPEKVRENAFFLSANSVIDKDLSEFFEESASQDPFDIIVPLTCTFDDKEKEVLTDLRLVEIFNLLFSDEVSLAERASLISTFRVLRKSYCDCYESDKNGDKNGIKRYIEKSYELYCEASQSPPKIDWFSENFIGSYTQKIDLKKINQILKNPTGYYTQKINLGSSSVNSDSLEESSRGPSKDDEKYYCTNKIPICWGSDDDDREDGGYGLTDPQLQRSFLEEVYKGLKELKDSEKGESWGLLGFPKKDSDDITWEKIEGKYLAATCSMKNFVNMFSGVFSEDERPIRTIICSDHGCLSAFIDVLADVELGADDAESSGYQDKKKRHRSSSRPKIQEAVRQMIVQGNGKLFEKSSLQRQSDKYKDERDAYRSIINVAYDKVLNDRANLKTENI